MESPEQSQVPAADPSSNASMNKQSHTGLYIGLAIGAIILMIALALGVVFLTINSSGDEKSSTSEKTPTDVNLVQEFSPRVSVKASTVDGETGPQSLSPYDGEPRQDDAEVGQIIPTFTAEDFLGKSHTVAPVGKPYILVFVAHWCPHCQKEVPKIVSLHTQGDIPKDVQLIAIATATSNQKPNYPPSSWLQEEEWPGLTLADTKTGTLATDFGLTGYPYAIYVGADGKISERTSGEQDEQSIIDAAAAISETKSS